jgi:hypothetical protein
MVAVETLYVPDQPGTTVYTERQSHCTALSWLESVNADVERRRRQSRGSTNLGTGEPQITQPPTQEAAIPDGPYRDRTCDLEIKSLLLYQLS